jgi:hypothetical protein
VDSQLQLVKSAKTAQEAWTKLCAYHEKRTLANKLFLRRKFFTITMDESGSMIDHINAVRNLADQLDAIGAPVSEDDIVTTLLGSLPDSYDNLITALESRADDLSFELVSARLLHEETKKASSRSIQPQTDVLVTEKGKPKARKARRFGQSGSVGPSSKLKSQDRPG